MTYLINTEPLAYAVRRRYNDFVWLRDTLANKYRGLYIPALPSSSYSVFKSSTDVSGDYIRLRMTQLDIFMQQLSKILFLRTDPSLLGFLSIIDDSEFKAFLDSPVNKSYANPGLISWNNLLESFHSDVHAGVNAADLFKQLDTLKNTFTKLEMSSMQLGKHALKFVAIQQGFNSALGAWTTAEAELPSNLARTNLQASSKAARDGADILLKDAEVYTYFLTYMLVLF